MQFHMVNKVLKLIFYVLKILSYNKKKISLFMVFAPINTLQSHSEILQSQ